MKQIFEISEFSSAIKSWKLSKKRIVLAGGCFDILHAGHVEFLKKAKKYGNKLLVLLESDKNIQKNKGSDRPINKQINRAKVLAELKPVNGVILLPEMKSDYDYDQIIKAIIPDVIAITEGDERIESKTKQAIMVGAELKVVSRKVEKESSSRIIKYLKAKPGKIRD
jgi:rfaE bifunctional protein nucleotidyltransferase chain/domain